MSHRILMYSFKGGAGRTVTTANVAYATAHALPHRNVIVIDLDVESAGASVLFNVDHDLEDVRNQHQIWALQDILREMETNRDIAVTRFEETWKKSARTFEQVPNLFLIPARRILRHTNEVQFGSTNVIGNFELLLRRIDNQFESPVVFLDSASGIQGSALMGLIAADLLVIFFRWSRQFINGTKQFIREQLIGSGDGRTRLRKVLLVPTAVPTTNGSDQGYAARVYQELQEEVDSMNRAARENLMKLGDWISIAPAVPEAEALKWDDQIFTPSYTKKNGSGRGVGALVQAYGRLSAEILHQAERPARA